MIKRIVKMTFKPEYIQEFKDLFNSKKDLIASVKGCSHVELLQDLDNPCILFTYSLWQNTDYIEEYRRSELFIDVWGKTKTLFDDKPEAYSVFNV